MRALVIEEFGAPPAVRRVPDPDCPGDGVVLRVAATGVCRSDWHAWQGHDDSVRLPHVPGHELAGTVVAAGPAVTGWRAGDVVTVPFVCACGACEVCAAGEQQVCPHQEQPGFTHWGCTTPTATWCGCRRGCRRWSPRRWAAGSPPRTAP